MANLIKERNDTMKIYVDGACSNNGKDPQSNSKREDYLFFEFVQDTHEIKPISREKLIEKVVKIQPITEKS